ncbi:MAG: phenol hydroxylase [Gammaproteobacteria bacterium]|nr:phenol hydroxylase [Gammaproteobacteria bacterium]
MKQSASTQASADPALDISKRYVRVIGKKPPHFVEFEYAVAEPEIFIEMILDEEAFREFCEENAVVFMDGAGAPLSEEDADWAWRLRDVTPQ